MPTRNQKLSTNSLGIVAKKPAKAGSLTTDKMGLIAVKPPLNKGTESVDKIGVIAKGRL